MAKFDLYQVYLISSRSTTDTGPSASPGAIIFTFEKVPGGQPRSRGVMLFYQDGTALPPASTTEPATLYFNMSQLGTVLEVLRQEMPLNINAGGTLASEIEAVGENERRLVRELTGIELEPV